MKIVAITAAIVLVGAGGLARAQDMTISGCAVPGVESNCVMLMDGDKKYNITHAEPKPKAGEFGTVTGPVSNDADICQEGTMLAPSAWVPDPEKSCPADQ